MNWTEKSFNAIINILIGLILGLIISKLSHRFIFNDSTTSELTSDTIKVIEQQLQQVIDTVEVKKDSI